MDAGLPSQMDASALFRSSLDLIDRLAHALCRRARMSHADAEDLASSAKLALLENDYQILRAYQGRSSLATYLGVIIQRLLADERMRATGRWHVSAAAERHGQTGVLLEKMLYRDGRTLAEAIAAAMAADPELTRERAEQIAAALPPRLPRPHLVAVEDAGDVFVAPEHADDRAIEAEARDAIDRAGRVVRDAIDALPVEDRVIVRLHFGSAMSVADISRMLRLPQRPLYRRLQTSLQHLREALQRNDIDASILRQLIGDGATEIDFGLQAGKSAAGWQTTQKESE